MDPGPAHKSGAEDWQCPLLCHCGIPRVTLSRTQTLTSSTMQDCSGLCFCTRHQLPALMTSTSPPAWSDTVVTTSARPDDGLFLRCSPQCKDEDDNEVGDDDDDDGDVKIRAWKENGLGRGPEDMRLMHRSKRRFSPSLMPTKVHRLHHVGQGGLKLQDLKSSACFDLPECLDSRNEPLCPAQRFTFHSLIHFELLSVHGET
ncbi:uncharacterized protein LOC144331908 isoform X2 [Macaca mulatta]